MTKKEFLECFKNGKIVLDGATGSNLQKRGMPAGVCPEKWIIENEDVMISLQKEYIEAGSDMILAPTFTSNRIKLAEYDLQDQLEEINHKLVSISKEAIKQSGVTRKVLVAGDITMTGKQVEPIGPLPFEELVDVYKEQVAALEDAGVDFFDVETMMSLQECRAAVIAIKECSDLPILVTLTFNEDGRTLYGTDPATAAVVLTALGVDAIGVNCSTGPDQMVAIVKEFCEHTDLPVAAKPNAGLPQLVDGKTVYEMNAEDFAKEMLPLLEAGADIVGGCCGTTPEHIKVLCEEMGERRKEVAFLKRKGTISKRVLTTERGILPISLDGNFLIIGERINPTGKKALQEELRNGCLDMVCDMAEAQEEAGASVLDVNMGMNGIDEKEMMLKVVNELTLVSNLPLSIDSSHVEVIEAALRVYPGRALINSISLEPEKFEKLIPLAKKYGAMFILLPLSAAGLPKDLAEKKEIIHKILERAEQIGLTREDIIVDGLVTTIGANKNAALEVLETISYCKNELQLATACGLSNISFGLPERAFINSTFMALAIREGLTMAIANPSQELLMHSVMAADLLVNKQDSDLRYIDRVTTRKLSVVEGEVDASVVQASKQGVTNENGATLQSKLENENVLFNYVVKGQQGKAVSQAKEEIEKGRKAKDILDKSLIPAINHVGDLFEKKIYFLPQLISSAETMKAAIEEIKPYLSEGQDTVSKGTIVIATVEHDIHDIGKNLVALMLENYGFRVIDLGKDVPAEKIIDTAEKENADIIALSALMTTTMMEMKKVVGLRNEKKLAAAIMIGGAVITQGFADEIGAEGYSKDAQEAVEVAEKLIADRK